MYDVIVAGAGPAGNMAALRLSEAGCRVAVVDWRRNIGDKLCTGIIGKECAERFPPDAAHVFHAASAATVVSPAGVRYRVARDAPQAYIVDRAAYVRSFAERAMEAGADYALGPRVSAIEVSERGVKVMTTGDGAARQYQAEALIIAGGFGSPMLRMAGLEGGRNQDYMVGCQTVVSVAGLEGTEVYLGDHIAPRSFGWLVPISESRALVGLVSRHRLDGHMARLVSSLRQGGPVREVVGEPRPWGIPIKPLARTYADRVLVVGDAAGLVKPVTGGGIYYALRSGELAAEALSEAFGNGDFSARQLRRYEKAWKAILGRELRIGYYARMIYEALDDQQIERLLAEFLSQEAQDELINSGEFSFDWHSKVILKAIHYRNLGTVLSSFGPIVTTFMSRLR